MSENVFCNVTRAGVATPIAKYIPIQLDKISAAEAASFQGADPHFTYRAFTTMLPMNNPQLVLFRDHLVDQVVIDPITHTNRTYLIIDDPEIHEVDGHWVWLCVRMTGI